MHRQRKRRPAFTLIELLVVIALVLLITALGVVAIPSSAERSMQSGAERLQGWLLIAKQRARRDGLPTGLRILFNPATNQATQLAYVQQLEDFAPFGSACSCGGTPAVTFSNSVDLVGAGVQAGDYLEFNRGGGVYQVKSVDSATTLTLVVSGPNLVGASNAGGTTTEWRIRRQPDLVTGEEVLQLPDGVVIDNTISAVTGQAKCWNLPQRVAGGMILFEVTFAPQGGMVGRGSGSDQICVLWLSNTNNVSSVPLLVTIQPKSGLVAVHQQDSGSDPYANSRDPRASGL